MDTQPLNQLKRSKKLRNQVAGNQVEGGTPVPRSSCMVPVVLVNPLMRACSGLAQIDLNHVRLGAPTQRIPSNPLTSFPKQVLRLGLIWALGKGMALSSHRGTNILRLERTNSHRNHSRYIYVYPLHLVNGTQHLGILAISQSAAGAKFNERTSRTPCYRLYCFCLCAEFANLEKGSEFN